MTRPTWSAGLKHKHALTSGLEPGLGRLLSALDNIHIDLILS